MSEYVNTVDVIGDEALCTSIINGTVTEIVDDLCQSLGECALRDRSRLLKALFFNVTSIKSYAFADCLVLTDVELPACTRIDSSCFYNSKKLVKVILRSGTVCTLGSTNAFTSTQIASGTGYIYVPDALVDDYKAATNWSTYADQIKPLSELEGTT